MHAFSYESPTTVEEAVKLLAGAGPYGRPMCGGTDLLVQIRNGVRKPELLVDVKQIARMNEIHFDSRSGLRLGAAVACIEIHEHPLMRRHYPGLTEAAHLIGSLQIQSRASVGGNLCNSSPAADTSPALLALGAIAVIAGPRGERQVAVAQFFTGPGQNVLQPGELVVELTVPPPPPHSADCYLRLIPRNEMDIAVVGAGAWLVLEGEQVKAARIGLGAIAPTPVLAAKAAQSLVGKKLDQQAIKMAAELAREVASPISDMRGTEEYRRQVVGVLAERVLKGAAERARSN